MWQSKQPSSWPWLAAATILAVGLMLYGPSLGLMLFLDDVPHMQWLSNQPGGVYWLDSTGFPVYRPATFAAWNMLNRLLGGPNAPAFHALSVVLHLAGGLLAADIAALLTGQRRTGWLAGLFFVAFPFSYGAVNLAAAQFHLWQTFGLLAGARLMLGWLSSEKRRWWQLAPAWLLIFWAIFQHENGVLAPVLVGSIVIVKEAHMGLWSTLKKDWRRLTAALGPVVGLTIVYLALRSLAIKADTGGLQLAALEVKAGQMLQLISFPLAALFRQVFNPQDGLGLVWLSGAAILGLMLGWAVWQWKAHKADGQMAMLSLLIILGLGWTIVAILPAWVFASVDYLLGSVRLYYLASVGIAWMWAAVLSGPFPKVAGSRQRWVISGLGLGVYLGIAVPFVWERQAEYRELDSVYRDIGAISGQVIANNTQSHTSYLMVLNAPSVILPPSMTFLLGSEGSVYLPAYVSLESLLWVNGFTSTQHPLEVELRRVSDVAPLAAIDAPELDRSSLRTYDAVAAVQEFDGTLRAVLVGKKLPPDTLSGMPLADFGNGIILEGGELAKVPDSPSTVAVVTLSLNWYADSTPQTPVEVFVHLSCDGELIAQADGPPLGRVYPFDLWQPGERWRDVRYFLLPEGQDLQCLHTLVGLYNPATGERLIAVDGSGYHVDGVMMAIEQQSQYYP
ncbi:MAG: hypothetical protein JXB30_19105 [Anaerolineae bacterium]|nr:hypothetical protein [Anaerolineae bacterium]